MKLTELFLFVGFLHYRIEECINTAMSKLGYLRMQTPKRASGHRLTNVEVEKINKDSENKKNSGKPDSIKTRPMSNWSGSNMDPDAIERHHRSLKRAGFRDNAHAKGFF